MAQQPQQNKKGGKQAKAEEPIVVKDDVFLAKVGRDLRNKNKKMDKIVAFKKSQKKGDKAPDANQQAMLDSEAPLKVEIAELKELVDLYKQSNPDWNVNREEAKKEEALKAEKAQQDNNNNVTAAFLTFNMMHHIKKNASFFKEVSGKNKAAMNAIMESFHKAKRADIGSADVITGAQEFSKLMSETDFTFVQKCFSVESIAAAQAKAAAGTPAVEAEVEAPKVTKQEVKTVTVTKKVTVNKDAEGNVVSRDVEKIDRTVEKEPATEVAEETKGEPTAETAGEAAETNQRPSGEHQPREERRGGRGGRGGRGDHRGGRGNNGERRGGYNRGPKTDDDGFMVASDRPAAGQRRGGERRGRGGYNNNRGGAEEGGDGGNFRRGGNRGGGRGRGEAAEARPPTSDTQ